MKNLSEYIEIYKAFNKSLYWLNAMVKQGFITKSEAGLIVHIAG